jgi:hypothetical protein
MTGERGHAHRVGQACAGVWRRIALRRACGRNGVRTESAGLASAERPGAPNTMLHAATDAMGRP